MGIAPCPPKQRDRIDERHMFVHSLQPEGVVMAKVVSLVSVLGRINPAAFDAIFPHGPILSHRAAFSRRAGQSATELNPQPLPPKEDLLLASAEIARDIAFAALSAEAAGNDGGARIVKTAIDDWCGTGRPHIPIPWPGPWPYPWVLEAEPKQEWDVTASRVVGALSLAAVAARLSPGAVRDALSIGAERLLDVALG
jgi:hypothetical protein